MRLESSTPTSPVRQTSDPLIVKIPSATIKLLSNEYNIKTVGVTIDKVHVEGISQVRYAVRIDTDLGNVLYKDFFMQTLAMSRTENLDARRRPLLTLTVISSHDLSIHDPLTMSCSDIN